MADSLSTAGSHEVRIPSGDHALPAQLTLPGRFDRLVVFAHESGRHSARNRLVAQRLQRGGMATLLLDVQTRERDSDIARATKCLQDATAWIGAQGPLRHATIGFFGDGAASAAALIAAARLGRQVAAVVSLGGRADLAGAAVLSSVKASTLLLLGAEDERLLDINQDAYEHLRCERSLAVVPSASHLFGEAGALEQQAAMAASWFTTHMTVEYAG